MVNWNPSMMEQREQGFLLPKTADPTQTILMELLKSLQRTEQHMQAIADKLTNGIQTEQLGYMDKEAFGIIGVEGSLEKLFRPQLVASVIAAGRVSTSPRGIVTASTSFILQDDTKEWNEEVVGKTILITSGPGIGERRIICALGEKKGQLRVLRRFRSVPTGDSTYVILDSSTYGSMFESSRTSLAVTAAFVNDGNANERYPYFINQEMQSSLATGTKTLLFGQLSKYKVRMVNEIRMYQLVERHRENDQDAFLAFVRADGNLLSAGTVPVKHLIQA